MSRPVLVMIAAALAACARIPTPEAVVGSTSLADAETCRVIAAALRRDGRPLSQFDVQVGSPPGPDDGPFGLAAQEAADLAAGMGVGGGGCDWRALGFAEVPAPARRFAGFRCGASFSRPWVSASGRLALMEISDGCGPEIGSGRVCLVRKTDAGWVATTECSHWIV